MHLKSTEICSFGYRTFNPTPFSFFSLVGMTPIGLSVLISQQFISQANSTRGWASFAYEGAVIAVQRAPASWFFCCRLEDVGRWASTHLLGDLGYLLTKRKGRESFGLGF